MNPRLLDTLKELALLGAVHEHVSVSTAQMGRLLGLSQQAASARILKLLDHGYVSRTLGGRGQQLKITDRGMEVLRTEYAAYRQIFELESQIRFRGRVERGLGEGFYYMSQEGYRRQFREKLDFDPYPGTLNLKLEGNQAAKLEVLRKAEGVPIEGFTDKGRTFGGAACFPASVEGVDCAAIVPVRSHYQDVLELIAPIQLRKQLGLRDGDLVEVTVRLAPPEGPPS